ncbi:hypothetical protein CHUAL_012967 [Chamberlinius hualienensis]
MINWMINFVDVESDDDVRAATGVVLVLGVGSVFCYKLVGYFINKFKKRRPDRSNIEKSVIRRKPVTRWASRELLDSCLNREPDLSEINKEYFGPVDCSDDELCSSCSDLGGNSVPVSSFNRLVKEVNRRKMGPTHSSSTVNTSPISYNVQRGVNMIDPRSLNAQKSSKDSQVPSFKFSGLSATSIVSKYAYNKSAPLHFTPHRPNCLPLPRRRRKKPRFCRNRHDDSNEPENVFTLSTSSKESRKCVDSDHNDTDDDCSSKLDSDEELLNIDGDDEDEEGEFNLKKRSESLVGNYSLQSLWNRQQDMEEVEDENAFNDEEQCQKNHSSPHGDDECRPSKCKLPVFVMQSSRSVSLSDEDQSEAGVQISDLSPFTPGFVSSSRRSIARDNSFGTASEISEISLDVSGFNNVGKQTDVRIDEIQKEIDDLKRDCLDMESRFSNMNAHGPTPAMYTELVKPSLSDISECSDYSAGEGNYDDKRVEGSLRRSIFKHNLTTKSSGGSADSSFDHSSANSCSSANKSANLSLEWDSMKCSDLSLNGAKPAKKASGVAKVNNGVDSGSDFGTPLTNCSPEPVSISKVPFDSARSLEWDEEFNELSNNAASPVAENNQSIRQILDKIERKTNDKNVPSPVSSSLINNKNTSLYNINCGVEAPSNKNMWSSMESGYIEEFTESSASCLVTPMADEKFGMQTICEHEREYHIRTWPVVGDTLTRKQLCSLFPLNSDFIKICHHLQLKYFRPIHCDGYSVLRSIILQMVLQGYSPIEQSGGVDIVKKTFSKWIRCNYKWLSHWRYPKNDFCMQDDCLRTMFECLQSLDWMTSVACSSANSEKSAVNTLNSDPDVELQIVEAAKLLMLKSALELYETMSVDKVVPNFVLKLFSRETSSTPEAFMHNHLNHIGCHQVMEAVDLYLLGHSLGVTICVISPDDNNKDDIMKFYPDCKLGIWPEIYLIKSESTGQFYVTSR